LKRQAQQDSGLSKTAAHECEQIASIPEAEFEAILAEAREKKRSITGEELIRKVRQRRRHAAARAKHTEAQRQAPEKAILYHTPALSLLETIPERSVDCLLTDPPYSTDVPDVAAFAVEWLPLALARIAPTGRAYVCPRNAGGRIPHHAPGAPVPEGADGG
jgi:hypothetical protein